MGYPHDYGTPQNSKPGWNFFRPSTSASHPEEHLSPDSTVAVLPGRFLIVWSRLRQPVAVDIGRGCPVMAVRYSFEAGDEWET